MTVHLYIYLLAVFHASIFALNLHQQEYRSNNCGKGYNVLNLEQWVLPLQLRSSTQGAGTDDAAWRQIAQLAPSVLRVHHHRVMWVVSPAHSQLIFKTCCRVNL